MTSFSCSILARGILLCQERGCAAQILFSSEFHHSQNLFCPRYLRPGLRTDTNHRLICLLVTCEFGCRRLSHLSLQDPFLLSHFHSPIGFSTFYVDCYRFEKKLSFFSVFSYLQVHFHHRINLNRNLPKGPTCSISVFSCLNHGNLVERTLPFSLTQLNNFHLRTFWRRIEIWCYSFPYSDFCWSMAPYFKKSYYLIVTVFWESNFSKMVNFLELPAHSDYHCPLQFNSKYFGELIYWIASSSWEQALIYWLKALFVPHFLKQNWKLKILKG